MRSSPGSSARTSRTSLAASLALAASLTLAACGDSTAPARFQVVVTTDKPVYTSGVDKSAVATIENRSNRTVYLPKDFYVFSERLVRGSWTDPFAWFFAGGTFEESIPLAPGEKLSNPLPLYYYIGYAAPLRIRYLAYEDARMTRSLPAQQRVTTEFRIAPAP